MRLAAFALFVSVLLLAGCVSQGTPSVEPTATPAAPAAACQNFPGPSFCPGGTSNIIVTGTDANGCSTYGCKSGTSTQVQTSIPAPTATPAALSGMPADCYISPAEIQSVLGVSVSDSKSVSGENTDAKCGHGNSNYAGGVTSFAIHAWKETSDAVRADLKAGHNFDSSSPDEGIGNYDSWWGTGGSMNFGKGSYKFQIQCMGDACSKDKAKQLAQIVLAKVS